MALHPYVVGQWVRAERFYGRVGLVESILGGNRNCLWLLGTRRIGKTSILKQIEYLASQEGSTFGPADHRYLPIFWDFQGTESEQDVHEGFRDAVLDAADLLEREGIDPDAIDDEDLFRALANLRRVLSSRDMTLLVLCDEAEELGDLRNSNPRFLSRFGRALQTKENVRTVLASTVRLWNLASDDPMATSFLSGFTPPLVVRELKISEASSLVRQSQLPPNSQPQLDDSSVEEICRLCNNHPYLLQVLSERVLELGDAERAVAAVANDQMISFFFASDLAMVSDTEKRLLGIVARSPGVSADQIQEQLALGSTSLQGNLQRLEYLGFVSQSSPGEYRLPNHFFRLWFEALSEQPGQPNPQGGAGAAVASLGPTSSSTATHRIESRNERCVDGRYELIKRLGSGSSGDVYSARDAMLKATVAVKLLRREVCSDDDSVERLRREVVLTRELSHPNLLRVFHLGEDRQRLYITMQYVEGADLSQLIAEDAPFGLQRGLALATKLASAVAALHQNQVLHRDIKPSNVLVDLSGEPKLTDFGLARLQWGPGITRNGMFLGTPAYAAPEQVTGQQIDERSDLYSLALVVYEVFTGQLAFQARSASDMLALRVNQAAPHLRVARPDIPVQLSDVVAKALSTDPANRFQTLDQFQRALEGIVPMQPLDSSGG